MRAVTDDVFSVWDETERPDPFGGVPEAPLRRRIAAGAVDVVAVMGSPWMLLILGIPMLLPFIEIIPIVVLLLVLSVAAALTTWICGRLPNGERLSAGRLVTGLTVLRTADASRVVLAKDVADARRPMRRRLVIARAGFAVAVLVAIAAVGGSSWVVYNALFQTQIQAAAEAQWAAEEPAVRKVCDEFTKELLAGGPGAGESYVVEGAAEVLPRYRDHLADTGVIRFEDAGWGSSAGEWEYMFTEVGDTPPSDIDPAGVSIVLQKRGDRYVVTQLSWHVPSEEQATP